ncbi:hypothetical protein P5V15_015865 [Pogonomyrmex californicus]
MRQITEGIEELEKRDRFQSKIGKPRGNPSKNFEDRSYSPKNRVQQEICFYCKESGHRIAVCPKRQWRNSFLRGSLD